MRSLVGLLVLAAIGVAIWLGLRPAAPPEVAGADLVRHDAPASVLGELLTPGAEAAGDARNAPPTGADASAPPTWLRGRVVDVDGRPIGGARVRRGSGAELSAFQSSPGAAVVVGGFDDPGAHATSRADGSFELRGLRPDEPVLLCGPEHPEFVAEREKTIARPGDAVELVMRPVRLTALEVTARAKSSGTPLDVFGVHVTVRDPRDASHVWRVENFETRESPLVARELAFVEPSEIEVRASAPGMVRDALASLEPQAFTPRAGETTRLEFTLDVDAPERAADAKLVRGRVLDASKAAPVRGALVFAGPAHVRIDERSTRSARRVATDARGEFVLAVDEDPATVTVEHPDYDTARTKAAGGETVEVALAGRGALLGRVVDRDGVGVPNACLSLIDPERQQTRARTDEQGRFEFARLLSGEYELCVLDREGDPDEKSRARESYDIAAGDRREVVLELDPPELLHVFGRVLGGDELRPLFFGTHAEQGSVESQCTADGYEAGRMRRGDYLVLLLPCDDAREGPYSFAPLVRVDGVGERMLDLEVPRSTVRGRVVDAGLSTQWRVVVAPDPDVLAGSGRLAMLVDSDAWTRALGAALAADGSFACERVPDGHFRLELRDGARVLASQPIHVTSDVTGEVDIGEWRVAR